MPKTMGRTVCKYVKSESHYIFPHRYLSIHFRFFTCVGFIQVEITDPLLNYLARSTAKRKKKMKSVEEKSYVTTG